jgi:hypothetical protein
LHAGSSHLVHPLVFGGVFLVAQPFQIHQQIAQVSSFLRAQRQAFGPVFFALSVGESRAGVIVY